MSFFCGSALIKARHASNEAVISQSILTPYTVCNPSGCILAVPGANVRLKHQPGLNNRVIRQARGKLLGGSSAINFLMVLHPPRGILDAWGVLGNKGWDYDSLSPYLHKFATTHAPSQGNKDVVGLVYHDDSVVGNGPIQVSYSEGYSKPNAACVETFVKFGLEMNTDPGTGEGLEAFQQGSNIDPATNTRSYAVTGHYTPGIASRPNLTVITETVV